MSFRPGQTIDRYRVDALLGQGGMGAVYSAYDTHLHRQVALKVLQANKNSEISARVLREARAAAALNHPNAVSIFDALEAKGEDGEPVYLIAMELIEGRDLRTLAVEPGVTQAMRLRRLADIARALAAAHRVGLVHRDMKPENVMVRSDGVVKVLDFGLARRATRADSNPSPSAPLVPTLTARGVVVGTPLYMSPEQLRADPLDERADQFSWAVVAYELLAGVVPWANRDEAVHLIAEILAVQPPPLAERAPDVPPSIAEAVTRALAKSPADRFPSMDAIVAIFDAQLGVGHSGSLLAPPSRNEPLAFAPTVQSTRTSLAAADALLRVSTPAARRRPRWPWVAAAGALVAVAGMAATASHRTPSGVNAVAGDSAPPLKPSEVTVPPGTPPEVANEYREAMRTLRTSDVYAPALHMRKAIALDPDFAPALLFMGIHVVGHDPTEGRELFRRAEEHIDQLSERDRAWLEAFKPFVQRQPADLAETRARMEKVVARFPTDTWLLAELNDVQTYMGDRKAAIASLDRAIALDPGFAYGMAMKAQLVAGLGDLDEGRRITEACQKVTPVAPLCVATRTDIERQLGQCVALEKEMRETIAIDPATPDWYLLLAEARFLQGKSAMSVKEAADQGVSRSQQAMVIGTNLGLYAVAAQVLAGDFAGAEAGLRAHEALPAVAQSADEPVHGIPAAMKVALFLETGRVAEAATTADAFLSRREVWSADPTRDEEAMGKEYDPEMLHALRAGGKLAEPAYEERLGAWIDRWTHDAPLLGGYVWLKGYAGVTDSKDDAARALDALPHLLPLPGLAPEWAADAIAGHVYLRAGDPAKALPYLRRGAAACTALSRPFEHVHALADLGDALDATGDHAGACDAYGAVLASWGAAKPRSVTADRVRPRFRALGCATDAGGR